MTSQPKPAADRESILKIFVRLSELLDHSAVLPFAQSEVLVCSPLIQGLFSLHGTSGKPARFANGHSGETVHALESFLETRSSVAAFLAEPSLAFDRRKAAVSLRRQLLESERLIAVIDLPGGLLQPATGIKVCLFIVGPPGSAQAVTFISADAEAAGFFEADGKGRRKKLKDMDRLASALLKESPVWWVSRVPTGELLHLDTLSPRRFIRTPQEKEVDDYFQPGQFRLGDELDHVSSLPMARGSVDVISVRRVVAAELARFGELSEVGGEGQVAGPTMQRQALAFLRQGDLLVGFSSASGFKLAVVSSKAPPPGEGGWLASRPVWVYRARPESRIDTRVVATLLASPLGDHLLQSMFRGRENVHARALLDLSLPRVDGERSSQAMALFERHVQCSQDILALRDHQTAMLRQLWPLKADEQGNTSSP